MPLRPFGFFPFKTSIAREDIQNGWRQASQVQSSKFDKWASDLVTWSQPLDFRHESKTQCYAMEYYPKSRPIFTGDGMRNQRKSTEPNIDGAT